MAADGSIRFETEVDTSGMAALKKSVDDAAKSSKDDMKKFINDAMEHIDKGLADVGEKLTEGIANSIKDAFQQAGQQAQQGGAEIVNSADDMSEALDGVDESAEGASGGIADAFSDLSGGMGSIIGLIDGALNKLPAILDLILAITTPMGLVLLPKAINKIGQELGTVFGRLKQIAGGIGQKVINGLKSLVSGGGGGGILDKIVSGLNRVKSMILSVMIFNQLSKALKSFTDNVEEALYKDEAFATAMGTLKGNIVTAFMPIWNVAVPALTTLINALATAAGWAAQLTATLFGGTVQAAEQAAIAFTGEADAIDGVAKSTKAAGKANDKFLASFDTIQRIGGGASGSGAGGGSSTATSAAPTIAPDAGTGLISQFAHALSSGDWSAVGKAIGDKLTGIFGSLSTLISWDNIGPKIQKIARQIASLINGADWPTLFGNLGKFIGAGIKTGILGLGEIIAAINWTKIAKGFARGLNAAMAQLNWDQIGNTLGRAVKRIVAGLNNFIKEFDWSKLGSTIGKAAKTAINLALEFLGGMDWPRLMRGLFTTIRTAISTCIEGIDWEKALKVLKNMVGTAGTIGKEIVKLGASIAGVLLDAIVSKFTGDTSIKTGFQKLLNEIIDGINTLIRSYNTSVYGKSILGVSMPLIKTIPAVHLAEGAVIPPNREFMAVLGDQTSGNNLEAPEGLIRRIVREESGGSAEMLAVLQGILAAVRSGSRIELNGRELGRAVRRELGNTGRASGTSVIPT